MAKIQASTNEKLVSMKVFGGLHESPDGDNKLKVGEAVKCQNFKVTNSGNLMKRFGTTLKYTLGGGPVMGMWHGWCTKHELTIAACDGHLMMIQDGNWLLAPIDLGVITTTNDVFMFGFDEKVYVMTGYEYCEVSSKDVVVPKSLSSFITASGITDVSIDDETWESKVTASGVYVFKYTDGIWKLGEDGVAVDIAEYGLSITGSPDNDDRITVSYVIEHEETQWSMVNIADGKHGYRPLVATGIQGVGGGALLEEVNKLNGARKVWITTTEGDLTYQLPEKNLYSIDWVCPTYKQSEETYPDIDNKLDPLEDYTVNLTDGTVTFTDPPLAGINSYEIAYSVLVNFAGTVKSMRYAEMYAGTQDSRVFVYGDGSNRTFYSGIDYYGQPRADYFPDLYEVTVGDTNTPITGLIRHYTKMLAFKPTETFSIDYGIVTLADGLMTPSFYTTPVNKNAGNQAVGQMQLVLNAPRTISQGNLYEWRNGSAYSANLSIDERQAKRISDRIYDTLRKMDVTKVHCYDDNLNTEYYIVDGEGNTLVHNYFVDAWYYYTGIDARMLIAVDGKLYIGTKSGKVLLLDEDATSDRGSAIDCYWESGSMDFGAPNMRKYSSQLWVSVKSEERNAITVTVKTDRSEDNAIVDVEPDYDTELPKITRLKIKVKKFVFYKLIFRSNDSNKKVTVVDTEIKVRVTSQAK